jgi:hypothetical protein
MYSKKKWCPMKQYKIILNKSIVDKILLFMFNFPLWHCVHKGFFGFITR